MNDHVSFAGRIAALTPASRVLLLCVIWFGIPAFAGLLEMVGLAGQYCGPGDYLGALLWMSPLFLWWRISSALTFLCQEGYPGGGPAALFQCLSFLLYVGVLLLSIVFLCRPRWWQLLALTVFFLLFSYRMVWHFILMTGAYC